MASIDSIILKSTNPFDNYHSVNFWQPQKDPEPVVRVYSSRCDRHNRRNTRSSCPRASHTLFEASRRSGFWQTYLLGRLKKSLNDKAFFAYIKPFPQSDRIWRHILRYTVDSMIQVPEGQQDSQLMLWLKAYLLSHNAA
jgi:hypothetical protein